MSLKPNLNEPLYRVWVTTRDRRRIAVTPAMVRAVADEFCSTVRRQINLGRERDWGEPSVELFIPREAAYATAV